MFYTMYLSIPLNDCTGSRLFRFRHARCFLYSGSRRLSTHFLQPPSGFSGNRAFHGLLPSAAALIVRLWKLVVYSIFLKLQRPSFLALIVPVIRKSPESIRYPRKDTRKPTDAVIASITFALPRGKQEVG